MAGHGRASRTLGLPPSPPHVPLRGRQHRLLDLVHEVLHRLEVRTPAARPSKTTSRQVPGAPRAEIRPGAAPLRPGDRQRQQQALLRQVALPQEAQGASAQIGRRDDHLNDLRAMEVVDNTLISELWDSPK